MSNLILEPILGDYDLDDIITDVDLLNYNFEDECELTYTINIEELIDILPKETHKHEYVQLLIYINKRLNHLNCFKQMATLDDFQTKVVNQFIYDMNYIYQAIKTIK